MPEPPPAVDARARGSPVGHKRTESANSTGTEGSATAVEDTVEPGLPLLRVKKRAAEDELDGDDDDNATQIPSTKRVRVLLETVAESTVIPATTTTTAGLTTPAAPQIASINTAAAPAAAETTTHADKEPDKDIGIVRHTSELDANPNRAENVPESAQRNVARDAVDCDQPDPHVDQTNASTAAASNAGALGPHAVPPWRIDTGTPDSDPEYEAAMREQMLKVAMRVRELCTGRRATTIHGHGIAVPPPEWEDYKNLPRGEDEGPDDEGGEYDEYDDEDIEDMYNEDEDDEYDGYEGDEDDGDD